MQEPLERPAGAHREAGFTLVELITVVGIIGALAAFALPGIANYLRLYQIRGAAQQVSGEIQTARTQAIMKNVNSGVVFVVLSPTTYRFFSEDVPDSVLPAGDSRRGRLYDDYATAVAFGLAGPVRTLPPGIQFLSTGGGRALRFDRLGRMCKPTSGNTACPDVTSGVPGSGTYWDATQATITVTVQKTLETNVTRTVQIQPAGVVRLQQ